MGVGGLIYFLFFCLQIRGVWGEMCLLKKSGQARKDIAWKLESEILYLSLSILLITSRHMHYRHACSCKETFQSNSDVLEQAKCQWLQWVLLSLKVFFQEFAFHGLLGLLIPLKMPPTELCRHSWIRPSCTPVHVHLVQLWDLWVQLRQPQL